MPGSWPSGQLAPHGHRQLVHMEPDCHLCQGSIAPACQCAGHSRCMPMCWASKVHLGPNEEHLSVTLPCALAHQLLLVSRQSKHTDQYMWLSCRSSSAVCWNAYGSLRTLNANHSQASSRQLSTDSGNSSLAVYLPLAIRD